MKTGGLMEITLPNFYTIFTVCSQVFLWTLIVLAFFGIMVGLYEVITTSYCKKYKEKQNFKTTIKKSFLKIYKE
jgi:hypothetical protein